MNYTTASSASDGKAALPSFTAPAMIEGATILRKYTKTETGYVFSASLDGFYFGNGILSVLPVFWPQNAVNADPSQVGKKSDVYLDEFAYSLNGLKASALLPIAKLASPRTVEVADFNGDGYVDVFIGDQGYDAAPFPGGQNTLLLGTKDGFVKGNIPTLLDFTHSSAIGDVDNDGDIDIFVGNVGAVEPYFLINDGKAGFTKRSDLLVGLPEGRPQYTGSALVDLNGDGKLELILGGFNSGAEILAWTGSKFVVQSHLYQADDASRVTTDVLAADIDGDRIPEIVMMSTNQSKTAFYDETRLDVFKLVSGSYQKVQSLLISDTKWNRNTYFSDMNDDGFLDIASLGHDSKIIMNDRGRFFVSDYDLPFEQYINAAEMWDLNSDGKLDLVYTQNGPSPSPADTGAQYVYVMYGKAGTSTQTIGVTVAGTSGNDVLSGTQNRDVIQGLAGNDTIDGGSNVDTAIVSGLRAAYTTTQTSTGVWSVVGPDGTDTLRNIEYLKFDDQTMRLLPGTGTTVNFQTDSPATFMSGIRDFDGNDIGASSGWKRIGAVDVNGDGDVDQIFVNRTNGRLAEVGTAPDGKVYFNDYGWAGETRVVGIYIDPLVQSGQVTAGGPNDSQRRFQNDLNIDNIGRVLGAADYDRDGLQEVYFALTDGTAYLHTYMHADGNIQYANYQSKQEVVDYLAKNGWAAATTNGWFV
jgi:hypothetical protein